MVMDASRALKPHQYYMPAACTAFVRLSRLIHPAYGTWLWKEGGRDGSMAGFVPCERIPVIEVDRDHFFANRRRTKISEKPRLLHTLHP